MINDFFSAYPGALNDQMKNLLLANTTGTDSTYTISNLWDVFFKQKGYQSTGALDDDIRQFLLAYLVQTDTGQATQDLWMLITGPYVP